MVPHWWSWIPTSFSVTLPPTRRKGVCLLSQKDTAWRQRSKQINTLNNQKWWGALQDKAMKTFWPQRVSLHVKEPEGRGSPTSATLESLDSSDGKWARGWKVFNLVFWKHFLIEPLLLSAFTASGWVQSVVRELTSCKLHGLAKKIRKQWNQ